MFFLRSLAEYAYYLFDEEIPYYSSGYDLHTFINDNLEEYLFGRALSHRQLDEQIELIIDEWSHGGWTSRDQRAELRFRVRGVRMDLFRILKQDIPRIEEYWHINHKLDTSFTAWVVIE